MPMPMDTVRFSQPAALVPEMGTSKAHASQHLHVSAIQSISRETQPDGLASRLRPRGRDILAGGWALASKCLRKSFQGPLGMWMCLIDLECAWFQGPKIGTSLVPFGYLAAQHPGKEPKRRGFADEHVLDGKYAYYH